MGVVKVDDFGAERADRTSEGERRQRGEIPSERDGMSLDPGIPKPGFECSPRAARDGHGVSSLGRTHGCQEHLVLAAAPGGGGVDVEDPHRLRSSRRVSSSSFASLVYV